MPGVFGRVADDARRAFDVQEAARHRHNHPQTAQVHRARRRSSRQSHGSRVERSRAENQGQVRQYFPQDTGETDSSNAAGMAFVYPDFGVYTIF